MHRQTIKFDARDNGVMVLSVSEYQKMVTKFNMVERATMKMAMAGTVPPHVIGTGVGLVRPIMLFGEVYICLKVEDWKEIVEWEMSFYLKGIEDELS